MNEVTLIDTKCELTLGPSDKLALARDIIREVSKRLSN
jgi:hypothetical protein